eukprot:CAMPEP_0172162680 /NCGR_PEP_ID=MMETSP1050-20130122/6814_1 /TAXON_ID=233186 /ORGANISM="Cryptomonas curvata, Strain CCAP979/52" /LENGTH=102 /DNA_ID=CAMNT_0012832713 /DNA_START=277 /DNA_END=585 /DNA_ORIENTATION=+
MREIVGMERGCRLPELAFVAAGDARENLVTLLNGAGILIPWLTGGAAAAAEFEPEDAFIESEAAAVHVQAQLHQGGRAEDVDQLHPRVVQICPSASLKWMLR